MNHDFENLKKNTIKELEPIFKNEKIYNLNDTYDLFLKMIDRFGLDKLKKSLLFPSEDYSLKQHSEARKNLSDELENYFKNIFKLLSIQSEGQLKWCIEKFWMDFSFLSNSRDRKFFFDKDDETSTRPTVAKEYFKDKMPFGIEQKMSYDLRNALTHSGKLFGGLEPAYDTAALDLKAFVIFYLFIANKYFNKLRIVFEAENTPDFRQYCDSIIRASKSKTKYYVSLNIREELKTNSLMRKDRDQGEEIFVRSGEINQIVESNLPEKKMILWAEAGMGKTTSLEYLAYADAKAYKENTNNSVPVYLALGSLVDPSISTLHAISSKLNITRDQTILLLKKGQINLYLDALNEVPKDSTNSLQTKRIAEIKELVDLYKDALIVVSNRPMNVNYYNTVPIFRLEKMNDKQVEAFIKKYSDGNTFIEKKIFEKIAESAPLRENIRHPLMLACLIEISKVDGGGIPESEGEIINRYIDSLYKREMIEKRDAQFNEDYIHKMLAYLGNYSFEKDLSKDDVSRMTKNEVFNILRESLSYFRINYDSVYVMNISTRLNILDETDKDYFAFTYPNFRNYYKGEFERIENGL